MHAVGSVIDIKGRKFVVCGHRPLNDNGLFGMGYLLVPYPLGYTRPQSFSLVSAETEYPVVHEGYRNEDAEAIDQLLEQMRTYGRETSYDEVVAVLERRAQGAAAEGEE